MPRPRRVRPVLAIAAGLAVVTGAAAFVVVATRPSLLDLEPCWDGLTVTPEQAADTARSGTVDVYWLPGPGTVTVSDWDPARTWRFHREEGAPTSLVHDGLYQVGVGADITTTSHQLSRRRERIVTLGPEAWSESSTSKTWDHCRILAGRLVDTPLKVVADSAYPSGDPSPAHTGLADVVVRVRAGTTVTVESATPTTVDGEPGTDYVWKPSKGSWLRVSFTLDQRNQLRRAVVRDVARNLTLTAFSADPTDQRIVDPSDQPVVTAP